MECVEDFAEASAPRMIVDPCWKVGNVGADEVFVIGLPGLPDGMCGRLLRLRKTILRMCSDTLMNSLLEVGGGW